MNDLRRAFAHFLQTLVGGVRTGKTALFIAIAATNALFTFSAVAATFSQAEIAAGRAAIDDIDKGRLDDAHQVADRARFPLLSKLIDWIDLTRPGAQADFAHISYFIDHNPDWPAQTLLKKHAEDAITDATPSNDIITWFQKFPPQGSNGAGRYIDAQMTAGQKAQAEATARQFLIDGAMTNGQIAEFAGRYSSILRQVDFELRADRLIWTGDNDGATQLLSYLSPSARLIAQTRIALSTQSTTASSMLSQLSADQKNDLGLLYERMRWMRRQNRDAEAIALLAIAPPTLPHAELWWNERAILARRALESGDPKLAYELARDHRQASGAALADGEWLSGWIALRFLNDAKAAQPHFDIMMDTVKTPISASRAAYWAGRAAEAQGERQIAERDYARASTYIGTFYGQIALAISNPSAHIVLPPQPAIAGLEERAFQNRELVQVVELLSQMGLSNRGDIFIRRMGEIARTPDDALLAMRLAKSNNSLAAEVQVSKRLMQNGMPVLADGFPVIAPLGPTTPEPALIHAIIRQESLFDSGAVSPSGALGLMQLMPGTAKGVAGKLHVKKFNTTQLTADPRFNVVLGSNYLDELVDRFNGSYVLAIAGYNAGPGRVGGWIRDNGDPRPKLDDTIDWIEKIGVYETRNYVQRVIENLEVYRARLGGGSSVNNIAKDLVR